MGDMVAASFLGFIAGALAGCFLAYCAMRAEGVLPTDRKGGHNDLSYLDSPNPPPRPPPPAAFRSCGYKPLPRCYPLMQWQLLGVMGK